MLVPPGRSGRLRAAVPGAQPARMDAGGHACNVTRPDEFAMWLIDRLAGGGG